MSLARTESGSDTSLGRLALLAIPTIVIGALAALVLWGLERAADALSGVLWDIVPDALGIDPSGWWIIVVLTVTGLAVGVALQLLPGHGGPDSATTELVAEPLPLRVLPGLALVTLLSLAGGVSLGPENPIIAINSALVVAVFARFIPRVPAQVALMLGASATIGALFGTPVAAALVFTGIVAAVKTGGSLWDKLFLPLAAAGSASITMHLLGAPPFAFTMPAYGPPQAIDLLTGALITCSVIGIGLVALVLFPVVYRALHALRHPILITTAGGLLLGILGFIGGPITMFKGLEQIGELLKDPTQYDAGQLAIMAGIKILALLISASALFRGGRVFPAVFIGVALGLAVSALFPSLPMSLVVASAVLGMMLVVARDGWLALFVAVAVPGEIALLPILCIIMLPAWLLVSRVPEFRIIPAADDTTAPRTFARK
ncbi:ion channel protein [Microbacterium pygmaeum]|uniref:H+/Cl-antiporter ClcA n=1 Tax=Microbacterium pygmaeum TaxID=370764 RepID=A0A1G8AFC5_9MICO|nr:ion channel protein [Microbacterium pygmaeum]SDH19577.1 H+/Cl-antiporter ClcA [Microbacterium pygmaeum]